MKVRISKRGAAYLVQKGNYRVFFATEREARAFAEQVQAWSGRQILDTLGPQTAYHLWDFSGGAMKGTITDSGSRVSYDFGAKTDIATLDPSPPASNGGDGNGGNWGLVALAGLGALLLLKRR